MADLILGQPSNLTTVTAGTGGNVRVTYAPWELDWEWFDTIVVGNWLANTTSAVSAAITAKGGAENLGYWFEVGVAFPNANWASGNRITPQRQAGISQFATFAAAIAAMAVMDVLLVWYPNIANKRMWWEGANFAGKAGSLWGMLSRCQLEMLDATWAGNNLAQVNQVSARNLSSQGEWYYAPTAAQEGAGIRFTRIFMPTTKYGMAVYGRSAGGMNQIDNCCVMWAMTGGADGIAVFTQPARLYNNTVLFCQQGYSLHGLAGNVVTNCVGAECHACFVGAAPGVVTYCADTDGSLPAGAGNLFNQDMRTQLKFFYDNARPGDRAFPYDGRILEGSVLSRAGLAVAGIPSDADNQPRPNPPSIGAYEPYPVAYSPAAQMARGFRAPMVGV